MRKSTFFVVLLAALLGGAVWYFEFKREKPAEDASSTSKPIFTAKQEEAAALTITRGEETLTLEKSGKSWRLTKPVEAAADESAVEGLLGSLSFGRISRTIPVTPPETPEKLKAYGLDRPSVTLEIKLKSGATHRLRMGAKDFTGSDVYALVDSGPEVALVPSNLLSSADRPVLEFRDRRIAIFDDEKLTRVRLKNEKGSIAAEKNKEGKWIVSAPAKWKGKELETERIVNVLRDAKAEAILDSPTPAERAKLARPAVMVDLATKDGAASKVEFTGGKGDVYVRSSIGPMLFKVARTVVDGLNFKPEEIVKKEELKTEKLKRPEGPAKKPN